MGLGAGFVLGLVLGFGAGFGAGLAPGEGVGFGAGFVTVPWLPVDGLVPGLVPGAGFVPGFGAGLTTSGLNSGTFTFGSLVFPAAAAGYLFLKLADPSCRVSGLE